MVPSWGGEYFIPVGGTNSKKKKKKKRVTRVVGGGERVEESFAGAAIVKRGLEDASLRSHG